MTRTNAREIAVHMVFGLQYPDASAAEIFETRMDQEYYASLKNIDEVYAERPNEKQMSYIRTLVSGVQEKQQELDAYIEKYAVGWKLNRIARISRAIMEVAIYEMLYVEDVPTGAAINEAVELCKRYDEEETASFVNGILGSVAKDVSSDVSGF